MVANNNNISNYSRGFLLCDALGWFLDFIHYFPPHIQCRFLLQKHLFTSSGANCSCICSVQVHLWLAPPSPCKFWRGSVMMPPAAAAATRLWMLAVGSERTRPCWPPRCPPALKGIRMGWFMPAAPPDITPPTALASC